MKEVLASTSRQPQRNAILPARDDNYKLIKKYFCRSFCKVSTSSTLTNIPTLLLKTLKKFIVKLSFILPPMLPLPFVIFSHLFVWKAFYLFKGWVQSTSEFARGNKHSQLFILSWKVDGKQNRKIWGFRAVWSGLQHLHDFVDCILFRHAEYIN